MDLNRTIKTTYVDPLPTPEEFIEAYNNFLKCSYGVDIKDSNGNYKSIYDTLLEVYAVIEKRRNNEKFNYGNIKFPLKTKYIRHKNRLYFPTDPEDGEDLFYYGKPLKASSAAMGYREYMDKNGNIKLIHWNDIEHSNKPQEGENKW